jgi:hypothetical protein
VAVEVGVLVGVGVAVGKSEESGAHPSPANRITRTNSLTLLLMSGSFWCCSFNLSYTCFGIDAAHLFDPLIGGFATYPEWRMSCTVLRERPVIRLPEG